ncbi:MAG: hypothetical protein ABFS30_12645, partial [Pseudomonadota bacterium]
MIRVSLVDNGLAIALLLVFAGSALAQQPSGGGAVPLTPEGAPAGLEAPPPTLPEGPAMPVPAGDEGISGIEVGELGELDP